MTRPLRREITALIEVGILFSPAIPAYIWLWPNLSGASQLVVQVLVYLYLFAGAILIGLRRWTPTQLGLNRRGIGLSLLCGAVVIVGRMLVVLAIDWPLWQQPVSPEQIFGDAVFYVGLVGLVEELIFRGLVYQALDEWRGTRLAIWGSALLFGLYHVGWQGPFAIAGVLIGLIFAAVRWRAGGIVGLIWVHGVMDILSKMMLPTINPMEFGQPRILHPVLVVLGYALLLGVPIYLWKLHPQLEQMINRRLMPVTR